MPAREDAIGRIMATQLRLYRHFALDRTDPLLTVHLTMPQLKTLLVLAVRGGASGHDLSATLGVGLATITGIVDRLVAQGLAGRREDPADRRIRRVELTAAGHELVESILTAGAEHQRRLLERLDDAGLDAVERALTALLAVADAEEAAADGEGAPAAATTAEDPAQQST